MLFVLLLPLATMNLSTIPPEERFEKLGALALAERRAQVSQLSREELAATLAATPTAKLLDTSATAAKGLGLYKAKLIKRERVGGKYGAPQTLEIVIRDAPLGIKAEFVGGPAKGRKVLYDATQKTDEMRVKEAGVLGFAGAIWLNINNSMTRRDSNHAITTLGFAPIIKLLQECFAKAEPLGGYSRKDDGFDAAGRFCSTYTAPKGGEKLYATRAKICIDPVLAVPVKLEIDDAQGPLEQYDFADVSQLEKAEFKL